MIRSGVKKSLIGYVGCLSVSGWYDTNNEIKRPNYETWLNQLVAAYQAHLDNKDRSFSRFLLDLPTIPQDLMSLLQEMCVEPDRQVLLSLYLFDSR